MSNLLSSQYTLPYPQKALNGELGLTSQDIARSLGVDAVKVRQKIKREQWTKNKAWLPIPYGMMNNNGMLYDEYIFRVKGAQVFVARWVNQIGDGYLDYLLNCEEIAEKKVPFLEGHIQSLKDFVAKNIKPKRRRNYVLVPNIIGKIDIFGIPFYELKLEKKELEKLTTPERQAWELKHNTKIINGLAGKNIELTKNNVLMFPESKTTLKSLSK